MARPVDKYGLGNTLTLPEVFFLQARFLFQPFSRYISNLSQLLSTIYFVWHRIRIFKVLKCKLKLHNLLFKPTRPIIGHSVQKQLINSKKKTIARSIEKKQSLGREVKIFQRKNKCKFFLIFPTINQEAVLKISHLMEKQSVSIPSNQKRKNCFLKVCWFFN